MSFGRKGSDDPGQTCLSRDEVVDRLNQALSGELLGVLGHLRRRHGLGGRRPEADDPWLRSLELAQQDHALTLAARITELGGEPILSPADPARSGDAGPEESLRRELIAHRGAAKAYRGLLRDLGNADPVTSTMIESICAWKESRADELAKALD